MKNQQQAEAIIQAIRKLTKINLKFTKRKIWQNDNKLQYILHQHQHHDQDGTYQPPKGYIGNIAFREHHIEFGKSKFNTKLPYADPDLIPKLAQTIAEAATKNHPVYGQEAIEYLKNTNK